MRFEGHILVAAPPETVWRALRDPSVLATIIPDCTRIEVQPGYRVDGNPDYTLGFEVGLPDERTGAEPILGWLHATRQLFGHALSFDLTLNDGVTRLQVAGSVQVATHQAATEVRYDLAATLPDARVVTWAAAAVEQAEAVIAAVGQRLAAAVQPVGVAANGLATFQTGAEVVAVTPRGRVVRLPTRAPAPTQGMLRRLVRADEQRAQARATQIAALVVVGGAALGLALAIAQIVRGRRG